jgi:hypothetical protein
MPQENEPQEKQENQSSEAGGSGDPSESESTQDGSGNSTVPLVRVSDRGTEAVSNVLFDCGDILRGRFASHTGKMGSRQMIDARTSAGPTPGAVRSLPTTRSRQNARPGVRPHNASSARRVFSE